jgi:hypothetical protein
VWWRRAPADEDDFVPLVLARWMMRIDGKLDEVLDLLRDDNGEAEPEP